MLGPKENNPKLMNNLRKIVRKIGNDAEARCYDVAWIIHIGEVATQALEEIQRLEFRLEEAGQKPPAQEKL